MKKISNSTENAILKMARTTGVVRAREIREAGLHPEYLRRLCKSGHLIRTGRGLYSLADGDFTEHHTLAEACKRVPHGIICLLSALSYHDIGTQNPHEVWMVGFGERSKLAAELVQSIGISLLLIKSGSQELQRDTIHPFAMFCFIDDPKSAASQLPQ